MYTKVQLLSYIREISQLSVLQDYLKVFNSPDDQFERAAVQKREKDQVIITCSGFVEMMEGMIRLVLVCSSCTGHVDGDVSAISTK